MHWLLQPHVQEVAGHCYENAGHLQLPALLGCLPDLLLREVATEYDQVVGLDSLLIVDEVLELLELIIAPYIGVHLD